MVMSINVHNHLLKYIKFRISSIDMLKLKDGISLYRVGYKIEILSSFRYLQVHYGRYKKKN